MRTHHLKSDRTQIEIVCVVLNTGTGACQSNIVELMPHDEDAEAVAQMVEDLVLQHAIAGIDVECDGYFNGIIIGVERALDASTRRAPPEGGRY